ncbi:MAG: dTDP-4-dehydrorhamnose reductase [Dehalobacter sp.]|nr:dTDP-4-dehydrorhamnose reductase [Dehalobacter sp.]
MILGAGGMLGTDMRKAFPDAMALTHHDVDITDREQVLQVIKDLMPGAVINAAAYTNVDGCEDEQELAFDVNGRAPGYIAEACAATGARLVHYSTDYVFDGAKKEYRESDATNPINTYGKSKLMGEQHIARAMQDYRIIRTSWLFGRHGKNFVDTMLSLSKQMDKVKVVNNQAGKPTYTVDLAAKTGEVLGMPPGIYHLTNEGVCTWYEFASAIIPNTTPCTSEEFPRKAKRPKYSVLVNTKTSPMRHWREALADYLSKKVD